MSAEKDLDVVRTFDEISCVQGSLGRFTGLSVMQVLREVMSA